MDPAAQPSWARAQTFAEQNRVDGSPKKLDLVKTTGGKFVAPSLEPQDPWRGV